MSKKMIVVIAFSKTNLKYVGSFDFETEADEANAKFGELLYNKKKGEDVTICTKESFFNRFIEPTLEK